MAELTRGPDYLRLHVNVRQRVRNLETGVHPTGSELNYYDTYPPTEIAIRSASNWAPYESGTLLRHPYWQRRTGLVMLSGSVLLKSTGAIVADELLATLPPEARPIAGPLTIMVSVELAPWRTRIVVYPNGELHLLRDGMTTPPRPAVWFDGAMWPVN